MVPPMVQLYHNGKMHSNSLLFKVNYNSMYVIGCSQYIPDTYLGKSCAFDPMGRLLAEGGSKEELILVPVTPEETEKAREIIPALLSELK